MKNIAKTPKELDNEFDNFKYSFSIKGTKKDGKTTVIASASVNTKKDKEQLTAQSTKETWDEAFDDAIDKLNEKAEQQG